MLFTRCPDCRTTFRINVETLHKADGQVRCGRCKCVFNAFERLIEEVPAHDRLYSSEPRASETRMFAPDDHRAADVDASLPEVIEVPDEPNVDAIAMDTPPEEDQEPGIGDHQVEELLVADKSEFPIAWSLAAGSASGIGRPALWRAGAALALLALVLQFVHAYRADLARGKLLGPLVQAVYNRLGSPVEPSWDPAEYEILDWATSAQGANGQQGNLLFTATITNRGTRDATYPLVHLKLTDRWQDTVASRFFYPDEYLPADFDAESLMTPGAVASARLVLVDPGPEAYGFEVDLCVPSVPETVICRADLVFD